jgi:hypothetical protein
MLSIIDVNGHVVYSQSIINNEDNPIDCSQLSSGVYFVNITQKDKGKTIKIVKK